MHNWKCNKSITHRGPLEICPINWSMPRSSHLIVVLISSSAFFCFSVEVSRGRRSRVTVDNADIPPSLSLSLSNWRNKSFNLKKKHIPKHRLAYTFTCAHLANVKNFLVIYKIIKSKDKHGKKFRCLFCFCFLPLSYRSVRHIYRQFSWLWSYFIVGDGFARTKAIE